MNSTHTSRVSNSSSREKIRDQSNLNDKVVPRPKQHSTVTSSPVDQREEDASVFTSPFSIPSSRRLHPSGPFSASSVSIPSPPQFIIDTCNLLNSIISKNSKKMGNENESEYLLLTPEILARCKHNRPLSPHMVRSHISLFFSACFAIIYFSIFFIVIFC
jgi:hypothetical protein